MSYAVGDGFPIMFFSCRDCVLLMIELRAYAFNVLHHLQHGFAIAQHDKNQQSHQIHAIII